MYVFLFFQAPRWGSSVAWTFARMQKSDNSNSNSSNMVEQVNLNTDLARGGVMISSWREGEGELISHLEMVGISPRDIGNYTCSLPGDLATMASATVRLHIVSELQEPVINRACGGWGHCIQILLRWKATVCVVFLCTLLSVVLQTVDSSS
jgi:hypothetical protein